MQRVPTQSVGTRARGGLLFVFFSRIQKSICYIFTRVANPRFALCAEISSMAFGQSGSSWLARLGIFGFIVIVALCIGGFFLVRYLYRTAALSPFEASLPRYLAATPKPDDVPKENQPFKPGIIAVDLQSNTLDHFYFDMPDSLRAANPDAVKTVVFLRWEKLQTHKYSNGRPGYTQKCIAHVVDLETKALLKTAQFQGTAPPQSISGRSSSGQGSSPAPDVVLFLQQNTPR